MNVRNKIKVNTIIKSEVHRGLLLCASELKRKTRNDEETEEGKTNRAGNIKGQHNPYCTQASIVSDRRRSFVFLRVHFRASPPPHVQIVFLFLAGLIFTCFSCSLPLLMISSPTAPSAASFPLSIHDFCSVPCMPNVQKCIKISYCCSPVFNATARIKLLGAFAI